MDGLPEDMTRRCQGPGHGAAAGEQVTWCPAWNLWLCCDCRWRRNESELGNGKARAAGQAVVLLWPPGTRASRSMRRPSQP